MKWYGSKEKAMEAIMQLTGDTKEIKRAYCYAGKKYSWNSAVLFAELTDYHDPYKGMKKVWNILIAKEME